MEGLAVESRVGRGSGDRAALFEEASGAAKDGNEADPRTPFCAGEIGMMSTPGWLRGVLEDPEAGCPDMMANVGVFALPGTDGEPAPVLLGGSNIAVSAKSQNQELAKRSVALMLSEEYQTIMAENGLTPARSRWRRCSVTTSSPQAAIAAASNARLTPAAAGWASVEGSSGAGGPVRGDRQRRRRRGARDRCRREDHRRARLSGGHPTAGGAERTRRPGRARARARATENRDRCTAPTSPAPGRGTPPRSRR